MIPTASSVYDSTLKPFRALNDKKTACGVRLARCFRHICLFLRGGRDQDHFGGAIPYWAWCRNGSRSRIRIAASISVTRCEPGPRVRVIGWASCRERSGADGRGNLFSPGLFNVLDCDDPPKSPKQKDRSGYNRQSNNTETDCHD